jgi:hypothetical protein
VNPPPSILPTNLPESRPRVEVPPYPAAGLDDPDVRDEWERAHREAAEARFRLRPKVLRAYAEAQLAWEKWHSARGDRKPSGDLRRPVPRDRLQQIVAEMEREHKRAIALAESTINSIETGDVVGVEIVVFRGKRGASARVPRFVLQSVLDRRRARANRTPEEVEAEWDEMMEAMLANLPPEEPELEIPNLPDLPTDREPTSGEIAAFSNAVLRHVKYVERGKQIEAKRRKDAATKVRTAKKREAEQADPEGTAAAKHAEKLRKTAERQRRYRERQKLRKRSDP